MESRALGGLKRSVQVEGNRRSCQAAGGELGDTCCRTTSGSIKLHHLQINAPGHDGLSHLFQGHITRQ